MQTELDRSVALAQSRPWRISPWLVIVVFGLILLTPAAVQLSGRDVGGAAENRTLAPGVDWAKISEFRTLSRRLEAYVNDRFGLRDQMVRANARLRYLLGLSSNRQVLIGRDGWLFYTAERILEQHVGLDVFKPAELEQWVARMEANREWLAHRGIPFVMLLAPDKNTIYPEKVPHVTRPPGAPTRADQIVERLKGTKLEFIDPRQALKAAKTRGAELYYPGDSHWSQQGAFVAYAMLMDSLAGRFPKLKRVEPADLDRATGPWPTDLVYLLGLHRDIAHSGEVLTRRHPSHIGKTETRMPSSPRWGWPIKLYETALTDAPRPVVFGDSFTDYILGPNFLFESVRDPVYTHHNVGNFNFDLVEEVKPDLVIVVVAERYLKTIPGPPVGFGGP